MLTVHGRTTIQFVISSFADCWTALGNVMISTTQFPIERKYATTFTKNLQNISITFNTYICMHVKSKIKKNLKQTHQTAINSRQLTFLLRKIELLEVDC